MGDSKRRKKFEEAWGSCLTEDERTVVSVARRLSNVLELQGACYRVSLFLRYYLFQRHGIEGTAVVGFVNDRTDNLYSSHAWFKFNGQKTDLTLSRPLSPALQKPGPLLIHGREFKSGWAWTYHDARPLLGIAAMVPLMGDPAFVQAENLHLLMQATARNDDLIRTYLDGARDGLDYETLAAQVSACA